MASSENNKLIIILSAVLLAVIVASAALLFLLPDSTESPEQTSGTGEETGMQRAAAEKATLDLKVFERRDYRQLNFQPVRDGSVPVQPPVQVGKANPFL